MTGLDYSDPSAVRAFLADVFEQARDAVEAGLDATAPPGARELGRASARRIIDDARGALEASRSFAGLISEDPER